MMDFRKPDTDWKNNAGSECPAFGVFAVTSNTVTGGKNILQGSQPSTTFSRSYAVNGEFPIAANGYGGAYTHGLVLVKYDTGTPAVGETWGPAPSQWTVKKGYPGFICMGIVSSTDKIMLARYDEPGIYLVKADADISKGSTGTCSLYYDNAGTETDTTINIADCKALGAAITSGKWATVQYINGVAFVGPWECS